MLGGRLLERTSTVVGGQPAEFAGTRGYPDMTQRTSPPPIASIAWTVQLQERFVDEVNLNRLWVEGIDVDNNTIPSRAWTNLVLGFQGE